MKATLSGVTSSKEASGQVYVFGNQEEYLLTTLTEQKRKKNSKQENKKKVPGQIRTQEQKENHPMGASRLRIRRPSILSFIHVGANLRA